MLERGYFAITSVASIWRRGPAGEATFDKSAWDNLPITDAGLGLRVASLALDWIAVADALRRKAHKVYAHGQRHAACRYSVKKRLGFLGRKSLSPKCRSLWQNLTLST